jgi:glutaredoxin
MDKRAEVRFYTRPGCHLCEEAREAVRAANCADEYTLEEINIDEDAALKKRYLLKIPVITINGREAFIHRLTPADFKRQVRQANSD